MSGVVLENDVEKYVNENLGLINMVAKRFSGFDVDYEDLFQIGSIGLLKAARAFDESKNIKFSTYAVSKIIGEIRTYIRDTGPIKVSRSLKENKMKIVKARKALCYKLEREPTINEIAKATGIKESEVILSLEATDCITSLDGAQNDGRELYDCIGNTNEEKTIDKIMIADALENLESKERKLVVLRFFKDKTQSQTARELGISQVAVSRLEKKILLKLEKQIE